MPELSAATNELLYDAKAVRELDRVAIEEKGIAGIVLMKRAGQAVFSAIKKRWPDRKNLLVLCGPGNNGADGYIVAGLALQSGMQVRAVETPAPSRISGDAKKARDFALAQGVHIQGAHIEAALEFDGQITPETVIVDALLGTGFRGDLREDMRALILRLGSTLDSLLSSGVEIPVISVDVPSGLDASTGRAAPNAIWADATVSFIGRKSGLYTGEGRAQSGELEFDNLGVPSEVYSRVDSAAELLSLSFELKAIPDRAVTNHKGSHGHVLVIGGDEGMGGAPLMTAIAAARMGAGLISVATHPAHASAFSVNQPELMTRGVECPQDLMPLIDKATVIAVGPGLGVSAWGQGLLQAALASAKPMVLDADALNLIAGGRMALSPDAEVIMTPHPGEAGRLLGLSAQEIQSDRFSAITQLVEKFGGVQVLKGSGTLVSKDGQTFVCPYGNSGMGTGGMGDVLTGVIAGLWAQGLPTIQAAKLGVCVHSAAADQLVAAKGQRGLLATDLIPVCRELLNGI